MSLSVCQTLRQPLFCSLATASSPSRTLITRATRSSICPSAVGGPSRRPRSFEGRQLWSRSHNFVSPVYMATHESAEAGSKSVLVPIANGTEEMEADIVIDVLRRAGESHIGRLISTTACHSYSFKFTASCRMVFSHGTCHGCLLVPTRRLKRGGGLRGGWLAGPRLTWHQAQGRRTHC